MLLPATLILVLLQLILPRKVAFVALLVAVFHLGNAVVVSEFTPVRLIIIFGILRAIIQRFIQFSPKNTLDRCAILFGVIALISTIGHEATEFVASPFIERLGLSLNIVGSYFYARAYTYQSNFIPKLAFWITLIVIPFGILMTLEQNTGRNPYYPLGARSRVSDLRNDGFRAKGPFGHAIISGTAAASVLPFAFFLFSRCKKPIIGLIGLVTLIMGALASVSSGPLAAMGVGFAVLSFWRWRHLLGVFAKGLLVFLIICHFTMSQPVWFLIAKVDIVGGSTGWHRSKLIDSGIQHLSEWWLWGTDHTRHWMPTGVSWNPNNTDITNYFLQIGVWGGLPLMLTFTAMIIISLMKLAKSLLMVRKQGKNREYENWCVFTAIIIHTVSFISIAYFDQAYAIFFLLIGSVPALIKVDGDDNLSIRNIK